MDDAESDARTSGRVLVIIPTYNEARQPRARSSAGSGPPCPTADVLVADDNSPDGTGEIADELAAADDQVHVLHRTGKEGLGAAYIAGFGWGLDDGYDVAGRDGRRRLAPARGAAPLLAALRRRRPGDRLPLGARRQVVNWPLHRELLSRGGNIYTRLLLGMPVHDATGGLPRLPAATLEKHRRSTTSTSQGYCFQVDLTWRDRPARAAGRRGADHVRRARASATAR